MPTSDAVSGAASITTWLVIKANMHCWRCGGCRACQSNYVICAYGISVQHEVETMQRKQLQKHQIYSNLKNIEFHLFSQTNLKCWNKHDIRTLSNNLQYMGLPHATKCNKSHWWIAPYVIQSQPTNDWRFSVPMSKVPHVVFKEPADSQKFLTTAVKMWIFG